MAGLARAKSLAFANVYLIPCVLFVLGGSLLDGHFPNAFSQTTCEHLAGQADRTHDAGLPAHRSTKMSVADAENEHKGSVEEEMTKYRGGLNTVKYVVLRVAFVVVLVVLAIVFTSRTSWARRTRSRSPGPA
ncbi:hypothetical protein PF006_g28212 [Phytophthora fragariae]|uniref:Uncharacterized protein n=1 Tax=Phytophthora fragariae TaxID=53985 RepID=A0A6A3QHJ8_9STRA|nr:hypothetical protein PF006_g28212 [Phytophthora fragariae]